MRIANTVVAYRGGIAVQNASATAGRMLHEWGGTKGGHLWGVLGQEPSAEAKVQLGIADVALTQQALQVVANLGAQNII